MYSDNLKFAEENASYLVREKSGILYLDSHDGLMTKFLQKNKIEDNLQNRSELRSYLIKSKNVGLYFNAIALTKEAYSQKLNDCNEEELMPNFLNNKGISHGILFDSLDFNNTNGLNYDEYLSKTFKYYINELKCSFIKVSRSFSVNNEFFPIKKNYQEIIRFKVYELSNITKKAQEAGLAVIIYIGIIDFQNIPLNQLFKNYEDILAEITRIFTDKEVLSEGIVYALPIVGLSHIDQIFNYRKITHEEIAALNFITWTRSIVPAVKLIYPHANEDNSNAKAFSQACLILNEIIKIEIKKPWTITFAMGPLLYSNSIEYWKGDNKKLDLASSLFLKRVEAIKASMNGDFKIAMAEEATFENNIKEVGDISKKIDTEVKLISQKTYKIVISENNTQKRIKLSN